MGVIEGPTVLMMSDMENLDCAVIGAGLYGLAAAKQYRCIHPDDSLAIFDSECSQGGTWNDGRLYPGLKSNNLLGTYEYPDFPMRSATFGVEAGKHIPGEVVNRYLKAYADEFSLTDLIRLNTKVAIAEHLDTLEGGWILTLSDLEHQETKVFVRRLIFATGMTSEAFLPHFDGQETFGGEIFHSKQFLQNRDTLQTAKTVTVFGATKFGWDTVYEYAKAGVKVDWIIRSSGHGPCWIAPPYVTPLKRWIEKLANTRFLTWFSPCIWGDADGYKGIRNFLHGTAFGRFLIKAFWNILGSDVMSLNAYDSHPETAKLKPWIPAMFAGASFSILNYETDFFSLVKGPNVSIHLDEIHHLSPGTVHLASGRTLPSDVLLANTGWSQLPPVAFLPASLPAELGIPHAPSGTAPAADLACDASLITRADAHILTRLPALRDQPTWNDRYVPLAGGRREPPTGWMLHRFMVPPAERFLRARDVAFVGAVANFSAALTAHVQGLWVAAYFAGKLVADPGASLGDEAGMEGLRVETAVHNRFGKWRYPTDWGKRCPSFVFDAVPYLDLLLGDLGLERHRKKGWLAEIREPYGPEDYQDVNDEWKRKYWQGNAGLRAGGP